MSISPARAAAFDILLRIAQQGSYASELLHSSQYAKLSPADHGLATELVMGVLRWQSRLDEEISRFSAKGVAKLDIEVLTALRLGAYQLMFLDRVPGRAAVHESVEMVKRGRKGSAVPFANAVLRKLAGSTSAAKAAEENGSSNAALKRCSTQDLDSATRNLQSATPSLDSNNQNPDSSATSLIDARQSCRRNWRIHCGWSSDGCVSSVSTWRGRSAATISVLRRPRFVYLIPRSEAGLRQNGIDLAPGQLLTSARRILAGNVTGTRAFREGRVTIQDEASQLVGLLVGKGSRILDCCAAPGGKTRVLAERNPEASIVALELHPHRARLLRRLVPAKNVEVINSDVGEFASTTPL